MLVVSDPSGPDTDDSDVIIRFPSFGPDRAQTVIDKAIIHEREAGDGVLAISVYRVPSDWVGSEDLVDFINAVPTSGRWIWPSTASKLRDAGFELVWDPTRETDRHYLIPFGVVDMRNEELLDSVTKLMGAFGMRFKNPAETRTAK